jgi:hypothetical protein
MATPHDPYQIPGTQPPEPQQPAEHFTVAARATIALWIASAAVAVALISAFFTWQQVDIGRKGLKLAKDANKLNADMVKATNAASFEPTLVMSPSEGYVDVGFQNTGKAIAAHFSATLTISRKTIPEYTLIGNAQTINLERGQIPPTKGVG